MKTTLRKVFLSILLIFVAGVGACFSSNNNEGVIKFVDNGICYKVTDKLNKTVEVVAKGKYTGSIVIPETVIYNDIVYSVTRIGKRAFSKCHGLTSVTISNSLTSIGERAFEGCHALTSIKIPNSVTSIGRGAFSGCFGLINVIIPGGVSIGNDAFKDTPWFENQK